MAGILDAWVLWGLAGFQFLVAWWWWRGPHLEGTRVWGTALFLLNGVAAFLSGVREIDPAGQLGELSIVFDRFADLFLLGLLLTAVGQAPQRTILGKALMGIAIFAYIGRTFARIASPPFWLTDPMHRFADEFPLLAVGILVAPALARQLRGLQKDQWVAWLLILAVIAMRFAEFAGIWFAPQLAGGVPESVWHQAHTVLVFLALLSILAVPPLLGTAWFRLRQSPQVPIILVALGVFLAGFLVGIGRGAFFATDLATGFATFLTLAIARPLIFVVAQGVLSGKALFDYHRIQITGGLFLLGFLSYLPIVTSVLLWDRTDLAAGAFGGAVLIIGAPLLLYFHKGKSPEPHPEPLKTTSGPRTKSSAPTSPGPLGEPLSENSDCQPSDWSLETRVPLPADWQERLKEGERVFQKLPGQVQVNLSGLKHWQRLILALEASSAESPEDAYERTTPGLHLATQCPYASVGPELKRMNRRTRRILEELGIGTDDLEDGDEGLVESRWGHASGLRSNRVRIYNLTDKGHAVARRLREKLGIPGKMRLAPTVYGEKIGSSPI